MSNRLLRIIAWWEVASGILGIVSLVALYLDVSQDSARLSMGAINYWGGIAFFSFTAAAGRALLRRSAWGLAASSFCQALQVISFAFLAGPVFRIQAGPILGFEISSAFVGFTGGLHFSFFLGKRLSGSAFEITVNVLAAIWTAALIRAWWQAKRAPELSRGLTSG